MWEWLLNESKLSLINPAVDLSLIKISFFIVKVFSKADEDYIQNSAEFPEPGLGDEEDNSGVDFAL